MLVGNLVNHPVDDGVLFAPDAPQDQVGDGVSCVIVHARNIAFESNDYQEAQAMVAAAIGVAMAPRLTVVNMRSDVHVIPSTARRRPDASSSRGSARRPPSPAATAFIGCLKSVAAGL